MRNRSLQRRLACRWRPLALLLGGVLTAGAAAADDAITKDLHVSQVAMAIPAPSLPATSAEAPLAVKASLDKADGTYRIGENVRLSVSVSDDAYVWVFDTGTSGKVHQIFPNRFAEDNFLKRDEHRLIPGPQAEYDFRVGGPSGPELVTVVATTTDKPLTPAVMDEAVNSGPFIALAGSAVSVAKDLSISLREEHPTWQRALLKLNVE